MGCGRLPWMGVCLSLQPTRIIAVSVPLSSRLSPGSRQESGSTTDSVTNISLKNMYISRGTIYTTMCVCAFVWQWEEDRVRT